MTKQRLHHFDVIKGIAILLVVMGHVLIMGIHHLDKAFLFKLIDKLHMPLFFFISGYFTFKMRESKVVLPNLWARFKQLIIPFICVSSLWILYFPHSGLESPLNATFIGLYCDVWKNGYWFTLCLFELILIYYLCAGISNKINNIYICLTLFIASFTALTVICNIYDNHIISYLSIELVVKFMPIFMLGSLAHKYKEKFDNIISNSTIFTLTILIGSITIYYACYFWEFPESLTHFEILFTILCHISLIVIVFNVVKPWCQAEFDGEKPSWIIRKLQLIGRESLAIYLLHYFFLFPMTWLRQPMIDMGLGFTPLIVVSLLTAIVIITLTLGVSHIISKSKSFSLLLLGKIQ